MTLEETMIGKALIGFSGAVVSWKWLTGSVVEKILMIVGSSFLAYFGTTPASIWVGTPGAEGLIGFLLGLFGMAIMAKIYESIESLDMALLINNFLKRIGK